LVIHLLAQISLSIWLNSSRRGNNGEVTVIWLSIMILLLFLLQF